MSGIRQLASLAVYSNIFLVMLGLGVLGPTLPDVQKDFDVSYSAISWAISSFAIARLLTNLPVGHASGRYSRNHLLLVGSACVGAGSLVAALSPNFALFLAARAATGVGSSICTTVGLTLVLDAAPPGGRGRASGIYHSALTGGAFIGPGVGGLIASFAGWRGALMGAAIAAMLSFALLALTLFGNRAANRPRRAVSPSAERHGSVAAGKATYGRYLKVALGAYVAAFAIFFVRGAVQQTLVPLIGRDVVGLSTISLSLLLMAATGVASLFGPVAGTLSDRIGRRLILGPAILLLGIGTAILTTSSDSTVFVIGVMITGIAGAANSLPSSMIADSIDDVHRAHAVGLYRVVGDVGLMIAPASSGWIVDTGGFAPAGFFIAALMGLVIILMWVTSSRQQPQPVESERRSKVGY